MAEQAHEITFRWPSTDAQDVIVTGSFDGWSSSTHLAKTPAGFEGTARVPFGTKVAYKYVVDGRWTTADGQPTELDPIGNLNNVYTAPPAPAPEPTPAAGVVATVKDTVAGLAQTATAMVEAMAPSVESPALPTEPEPEPAAEPAPAPADPAPAPAPAPELSPTSEPFTPGTVLPASELAAPHLAPDVPMHILPLEPEPLKPTVVEGSAPAPAVNGNGHANGHGAGENAPSTHEAAGAPLVGEAKREGAMEGEGEGGVTAVEAPAEQPAPNGAATEAAPAPAVNGVSAETKPAANGNGTASPATNGTTPTTNGTPASPPTTPAREMEKEKPSRMRFPSLSARRSQRSASSANTSLTSLGDSATPPASPQPQSPRTPGTPGKETHASRAAAAGGTVRQKRTSIFGKLKGIFDAPNAQANGHGKTTSNGA